jgi:hypothetical protein
MLERRTHPTQALKVSALESASYLVTHWSQSPIGQIAPAPKTRKQPDY